MKNLTRRELQRLIKLEVKSLMDEDALFRGHDIPGNDDEYNDYSLQSMNQDCGCGSCHTCDDASYDYMKKSVKVDHDRHSSYMARPQLTKISKYASHLLDMIDEGEELEDWQESKIAQMSQMMGDVYHSIDYDEESEDESCMGGLLGMIDY